MGPLPGGTVTLLFSDIEGSTSMLSRLGTQWGEALAAQRSILRAAFEAHSGVEVGTEGDSFFVVFTSAHDAVLAAVEAQRGMATHDWPGERPMRIRVGLHTGEPQRHEDGYIGIDVHRAARICAAANGGQTVMSAATEALVSGREHDLLVSDLGRHRLKDLPSPEHLFDVAAPDLAVEHPPLRSLGTASRLPSYSTPIVDRSGEIRELTAALMGGARLITLTGPGGTGKTRLAVATAYDLQDRVGDQVFFVPLHTADRAALLWAEIAEAVAAPADSRQQPDERALSFLKDCTAVIILDNVEQIPDADEAAARILNEALGVRLLVTSRRPLHLVEERLHPVPPLTLPRRAHERDPELARTGAVRLFVDRARQVRPRFELTETNVRDVVALCRRLDGLPLAIELAAARSRLLSPRALLRRIDGWLDDAGAAPADRIERQRTLASTIAWSYDLLAEHDRRVFARLGVFSSSVDLRAVDRVVTSDDIDPLEVVAHLADASLVEVVEGPDGEPVLHLLQTIRQFARERLEESGELDNVLLRHAQWCLDVAQQNADLLSGPRQMAALDRMQAVEEDVRAALDWTLGDPTAPSADRCTNDERLITGFALLQPMDLYWYRFGYHAEGRGWHERALRLVDSDAVQVIDAPGIVDALIGHGIMCVQQNDLSPGEHALRRALEMAQRLGDGVRESRAANSLGIARRESGDVEEAQQLIERSVDIARRIGDRDREATALANMVHLHVDRADYSGAVDAARAAIAADQALQNPWGVAISRVNLAQALLHAEGPAAAWAELEQVAPQALALGDVELSIDVVDAYSSLLAAMGDPATAATMLGAADVRREVVGIPRPAPDQARLEDYLGNSREALGPVAWAEAYAQGRTLTIEDAAEQGSACAKSLYATVPVQQTREEHAREAQARRTHGSHDPAQPVVGGPR